MADVQLTPQQAQAVTNRGGSLLVSAAAGSGKTKVLVERVFSYLTEEHCHIDDFLIITFTRAAAAELRSKLASELAKRVAQSPEDEHLRRQMFRVYQADIKTVDGFCASLLREHVHLLEPVEGHSLTPDFRILDESEASLLKEKALEQALESFYQRIEQGDEGCASLAATLGFGRDDRALAALVLVCAGIYVNWLYAGDSKTQSLDNTLDSQKVMSDDTLELSEDMSAVMAGTADETTGDSYFASVRLSRQQARDEAINLLQEAASVSGDSKAAESAADLEDIVQTALSEAQIESLIIAKGYADCVAYMTNDGISVAVSAPEGGLQQQDVAVIADVVMSQSGYGLDSIRVVEVR